MRDLDICVIGSGPAGAIAAVDLASAGFSVLLLETGGDRPEASATDGLGGIDVGGAADVSFGRAFQVGGSSNLWAGRVAPLEPIDLADRSWVPYSGWPVEAESLTHFFDRARELVGAPSVAAAPPEAPHGWHSLFSQEASEMKLFAWAKQPFAVAPWLHEKLSQLPKLALMKHARVTELLQDQSGTVTHAKVRFADGQVREIGARTFILAAGGIETTRILFNSTGRSPDGIGNRSGNLGRFFSTHPKADVAALILNRRVPLKHPLFLDTPAGSGRIRAGIGLSAAAQSRLGGLNHYVQLSPLIEYRASRAFEIARSSQAVSSPLINRSSVVRGVLPGIGLWIFDALGRVARLQRKARIMVLRGFFDQYPDPDNRLSRSTQRDEAGMPKIDIHWRFRERDQASVLDFLGFLDTEVRKAGIGSIDYAPLAAMKDWPITSIHSHFIGTTRMGRDERHSVTDPDCRVHGTGNLYIAGPSLFPTYGYANPFLTIAAMSMRLAATVAARG